MSAKSKYDESRIITAIQNKNNHSMAAILREAGLNPETGGYYPKIKNTIKKFGLCAAHLLGQGHNIGKPALSRTPFPEFFQRYRSKKATTVRLKRALLESGRLDRCEECFVGNTWNKKSLTIQVDHIDGNNLNNSIENLRLMCPNCHSQTVTFCGKNKDRKTRITATDEEIISAAKNCSNRRQLLLRLGLCAKGQGYARLNRMAEESKLNFK